MSAKIAAIMASPGGWLSPEVGHHPIAISGRVRLARNLAKVPFPGWAKALTMLLAIRPIMGDLSHGNVNLFILFLIVASLSAFSHRRDFLATARVLLQRLTGHHERRQAREHRVLGARPRERDGV